jgi:hypothetical protein
VARHDWLLLIHQIPARPLYLRARVRTLLERAGAVALKNSVYAMPRREGALDRLQAVAAEVRERGGEAFVCEARLDEADEKRLIEASRRVRDQDYADVRKAAGERAAGASARGGWNDASNGSRPWTSSTRADGARQSPPCKE